MLVMLVAGVVAMADKVSGMTAVYVSEGAAESTYNAPVTDSINGHDWVDMGLSVKWATCNVGASSPEEYGSYIAWGETGEKESYDWDTYAHMTEGCSDWYYISKYQAENYQIYGIWYKDVKYWETGSFGKTGDDKTTLEAVDDAAYVNWGGDWAMPTDADFTELIYNCTWKWTTANGVNGYKVFAENGNSIFLPAAGFRFIGNHVDAGSKGYYWSSSLYEGSSNGGRYLYLGSDIHSTYGHERFFGQSVRPVCPSSGNTNGHVAVDLGLPSGKLWAACNVGASSPEEYGSYIAWGETKTKKNYSWSSYKHVGDFVGDGKTTLEAVDDAATTQWGEEWRLPTASEWGELCNSSNCDWTWTDDYNSTGVAGYIVTSKVSGYEGNSIFLPAAGYRNAVGPQNAGSYGNYWSSSLDENDSSFGCCFFFRSGYLRANSTYRFFGESVRPVCPSEE